jgi:hypothetical protein
MNYFEQADAELRRKARGKKPRQGGRDGLVAPVSSARKQNPGAASVEAATSKKSRMRRFVLERSEDLTGTSGTGIVAEGVVFSNGHVAYTWLSPLASVTVVQSVDIVEKLHGHDGRAHVRFIDDMNAKVGG